VVRPDRCRGNRELLPQRTEFLYSARNTAEYDEIAEMFSDLYPDVAVPEDRRAMGLERA